MPTNSIIFLIISIFLFLSYLFGILFSKIQQPRVISEILVGICLGPSLLGLLAPNFTLEFFNSTVLQGLGVMKELGLLLLMFCSGYEINSLNLRKNFKTTLWGVLLGLGIPAFFATIFFSNMDLSDLIGTQSSIEKVKIVLVLSSAVTSIPIISRILMDLGLISTPFAKMILSIAIVEDLFLYSTLNGILLISIQTSQESIYFSILKHILISGSFLGIIIIGRNKIYQLARITAFRKANLEKYQYITLVVASLLMIVFLFERFGITGMVTSFACGLVFAKADTEKAKEIGEIIKRFSFATFIPIYFVMVGLKINLNKDFSLYWLSWFLVISSILKISGGFLAGKFSSFSNAKSLITGVTLNARGGPGIVIASVSYDAGIISGIFFLVLVLTALITSSFTGTILKKYRTKVLQYN